MKRLIQGVLVLALMVGMAPAAVWADEVESAEEATVSCPTCRTTTVTRHITDKVTRREMRHLCPMCGTEWKLSEGAEEQEAVHVCDTCGSIIEQCAHCRG